MADMALDAVEAVSESALSREALLGGALSDDGLGLPARRARCLPPGAAAIAAALRGAQLMRWLAKARGAASPCLAGADFVDQSGNLAAFDPTAHEYGPAGLLLREDLLGDYLEREGLALIWAVNGDKLTAPPGRDWRWDGFLHFSGAYRYASEHVTGGLTFRFREEPSAPDEGQ